MLNCIIIDDEQVFIDLIKNYLINIPGLNLVGEASSVQTGIALVQKTSPDLIFLDIELPDGESFEILAKFPLRNFQIIFTTSHSEYAIKAIRHSAIDYLLKPIQETELMQSLNKAIMEHGKKENWKKTELMLNNLKTNGFSKLAIPSMDGVEFVEKENIQYCKADQSYTKVYLKEGHSILTSYSLKKVDDLLEESNFFRVHKSYVINMNCIKKVMKAGGGEIIMENDQVIPIARRKKDQFIQLIGM